MDSVQTTPNKQIGTCPDALNTIVGLIVKKKFHVDEIGDFIPGNVVFENNNGIDTASRKNNGTDDLAHANAKAQELWAACFEFFFPPEESTIIGPVLFRAIRQNLDKKVYFYFQRTRPAKRSDYKWHFSTSRLCMHKERSEPSMLFHFAIELKKANCCSVDVGPGDDYTQTYYTRFMLLSKREKEIIKLIVEGKSSWDISETLYISIHTVNNHRKNIIRKLEINSLCQLAKFAISFNIV